MTVHRMLTLPKIESVHTDIVLQYLHGREDLAMLMQNVRFWVDGEEVVVPKGFVIDGASVPWPIKHVIRPFGVLLPAAVLHDWMYANSMGRRKADKYFLAVMQRTDVDVILCLAAYSAVRRFGWWAYYKRKFFKPRILNIEE